MKWYLYSKHGGRVRVPQVLRTSTAGAEDEYKYEKPGFPTGRELVFRFAQQQKVPVATPVKKLAHQRTAVGSVRLNSIALNIQGCHPTTATEGLRKPAMEYL